MPSSIASTCPTMGVVIETTIAQNRQGITENARRVKELEREVAELKALVAKLVNER